MNCFSLRDLPTFYLPPNVSIMFRSSVLSNLMRWKSKNKYTWLLWQFPDLREQAGSHYGRPMWHYKSLKIFSKLSVSRKILYRNVGKSQNTMKPFFLNFPYIINVFLLVPPAVLVIIEDATNFQDFLSFLKFIYTPFKRVSKVTELDVGKSQNRCAYHSKVFFLWFLIPTIFLI